MAGTALRGRLSWRIADIVEVIVETPRTKSLMLAVPDWPGHLPGQHVDVRLTADDGYQTERSYSIASAPEDRHVVLTVEVNGALELRSYDLATLKPLARVRLTPTP